MDRFTYDQQPMHRILYAVSVAAVIGQPFTATVPESPSPGVVWVIQHAVVEIPNYVSGAVTATLYLGPPGALLRIAGTNQGQFDTLDGVARRVHPGDTVSCTWNPTRVLGNVQGRLVLDVIQGAAQLVGRA